MPIVPEDNLTYVGLRSERTIVAPPDDYEYNFFEEVVPAAFRLENTIGSFLSDETVGLGGVENQDFDPFSRLRPGDEQYSNRFAFADTPEEVSKLQAQIDRETRDKDILRSSGGLGTVAAMAAGVLDPINFIPVGGAAYKTYRTGGSILRNAGTTARAGLLSSTASEALLQNNQMTRTYGESAANIAASTLFSGILGGGVATVRRMIDGSERSVDDVVAQIDNDLTVGNGSVGAARVKDLDPESISKIEAEVGKMVKDGKIADTEEGIEVAKRIASELLGREGMQKNWAVNGALKIVGDQDPTLRILQSPSQVSRELGQEMFETPLVLGKNEVGEATPLSVQALIRGYEASNYRALSGMDDDFVQYVTGHSKNFGDIVRYESGRLLHINTGKMSYRQFREAVGKAARREDDASSLSGIPEDAVKYINSAAKRFRSEVYDPATQKAIDVGLLPEGVDPKTAASYLNRVYDLDKLAQPEVRARFIDVTSEWLVRKAEEARVRTTTFEDEVAVLKKQIQEKNNEAPLLLEKREQLHDRDLKEIEMQPEEFRSLAAEILQRIKGTPAGRLPYDVSMDRISSGGRAASSKAGPLKARVFMIEDELIEEFLVNDIEQVAKRFVRSIAPDIELTKKFGDIEITSKIKEIQDDYMRLMERPDADVIKLEKRMNADIRDIAALRDSLRNVYGVPENPMDWKVRTGRAFRQLNYIRLLGGMTISAIPDIARPVMVHGFGRVFGDAIVPLVRNFSAMGKLTQQMRDMGLASDMINNSRIRQHADVTDDFLRHTMIERGLGAMSDTMGMVSLMALWNTAFKQMTGVVSMNRMIRGIDAEIAGTISKKERTYLRQNYIGKEEGSSIRKMLNEHGDVENGVQMPNALEWTDRSAYDVFQAALNREVDRTIVTPGLDKPLIATSTEVGRLAFQFKSFAIAATQRIMLSGLQQKDMATLNGMLFAVSLGMTAAAFKMWDSGRGEELKNWTTEKWIAEGVDRSGVTGWLFEANNMIEKATRGSVGVSALTGGKQMSRYASRNLSGALLGPTAGTLNLMATATGSVSSGILGDDDWKASDTHAVRKLLPYQNLLFLRQMLDSAEKGINSSIGAK
jgi:hypothetical protein